MKIRDMDIYFTVPVDRAALAACRRAAGYETDRQFQAELERLGYPFGYIRIERRPANIRGDMAELIADVLGQAPDAVFPAYSAAKAAAEREANEQYYKPFTTIEGRNAAIVAAMEPVKYTALKYGELLHDQYSLHQIEQDEIISIAFETLVYMADRAMKKGIHKGVAFDAAACTAVKQAFLLMGKQAGTKRKNAVVLAADALDDYFSGFASPASDPLETVILRDDALEAYWNAPQGPKRSKLKKLLEDWGINPKRRAA